MQYSRLLAFTLLAVTNFGGALAAAVAEPALVARQSDDTGRTTPLLKSTFSLMQPLIVDADCHLFRRLRWSAPVADHPGRSGLELLRYGTRLE
jgi:hypothetical protein